MARLVKCYGTCGEKHSSDAMVKISGKNYCPECYKVEITNRENRDAVYRVIAHAYDLQMPTTLMKKHVKDMHENYGWSYKRILALADYAFNKKKIKMLDMKYGVKHLENYYHEMMQYYRDKKKQKEMNKGKRNPKETKVIKGDFSTNTYRESKIINLEELWYEFREFDSI